MVAELEAVLGGKDCTLFKRDCPAEFEETVLALRKQRPAPPFRQEFLEAQSAGLLWFDLQKGGRTVAVQALRFEEISTSLADHLSQQYAQMYCGGDTSAIVGHAPQAARITGKICYHGEMFVAKGARHKHCSTLLADLAQIIAFNERDVDVMRGFVEHEMYRGGYAHNIGYWKAEPYGTHYAKDPTGISKDDWLVWKTRADFDYWMELAAARGFRTPESYL